MKNLTPEIIAKAKAAKSADELFALAKANNVEITEDEAKTYWAQLNANGTVADEELDFVAGGGLCPGDDEEDEDKSKKEPSGDALYINCPFCNRPINPITTVCPFCSSVLRFA